MTIKEKNKVFANNKKNFLKKRDKSKKGNIDIRAESILNRINSYEKWYSTSSCSGRVYLWRGEGKKNEVEWIRMSHEQVNREFFDLPEGMSKEIFNGLKDRGWGDDGAGDEMESSAKRDVYKGEKREARVIWFRLEPTIFHVCCKSIDAGMELLDLARRYYKKSSFLGVGEKVMVEIRGSEFIEMPFYVDRVCVFCGDKEWLVQEVNTKMDMMWKRMEELEKALGEWLAEKRKIDHFKETTRL